jgi:hypothetical protein
MSPAERTLWLQVQRAIQRLRPDLSDALIDAWDLIREALPSTPKLRDMVVAGDIDGIARAVLSDDTATQAFQRVRVAIRRGVERSALRAESVLPKAVQPKVGVRFDVLNPEIARALQTLEGDTMTRLSADVREAVRQAVARGIERGDSPLVTARAIRDVIGLTPRQELIVDNYRRELLGERTGDPLSRALRDRRFDARTAKGALTEAQIGQQVDAYRRRIVNHSADVYATTVSGQAQRLGGQATWKQAQESLGGNGTVMKKWHHSPIPEEPRPEHVAMDGVEVPVDQPYPNGDMYPGEHDPWNCRCVETYRIAYPQALRVAA